MAISRELMLQAKETANVVDKIRQAPWATASLSVETFFVQTAYEIG